MPLLVTKKLVSADCARTPSGETARNEAAVRTKHARRMMAVKWDIEILQVVFICRLSDAGLSDINTQQKILFLLKRSRKAGHVKMKRRCGMTRTACFVNAFAAINWPAGS